MQLKDVSTVELAEVFAINSMAPFTLCSKLRVSMQSPFQYQSIYYIFSRFSYVRYYIRKKAILGKNAPF